MAIVHSFRTQIVIAGSLIGISLLLLLAWTRHDRIRPLQFSFQPNVKALQDCISNETLGFEKIFAISLPSRTDQRDGITLAAAFTHLDFEIIDGVTNVSDHALPPDTAAAQLSKGVIGSWRAHLNAIRTVVERNISSALIIEGDVDWDIHIKKQMHTFATASKMLVQPLARTTNEYVDPTYPEARLNDRYKNFAVNEASVTDPLTSPYGDLDRWDVFWLGHCGSEFPIADKQRKTPLARIVIANDETVAEPQHLEKEWGSDEYITGYAPHTRIVSRARENVCSLAYAVSQRGARKILYEVGLKSFNRAFDIMLREVCDGLNGRPSATCLSVQPPLFEHHRPIGSGKSQSDISEHRGYVDEAFTTNVRWSTRVNLEKFIIGETDYVDSLPNGAPAAHHVDPHDD